MPTVSSSISADRALVWAGWGSVAAGAALLLAGVGSLAQLHGVFSAGIGAVLVIYGAVVTAAGIAAVRGRHWVSGILVAAAVLHLLAVGEMAMSSKAWWLWLVTIPLLATAILGVISRVRRARWDATQDSETAS